MSKPTLLHGIVAGLAIFCCAASVHATTLTVYGDGSLAKASEGETAFLAGLTSTTTESFEGFTASHDAAHAKPSFSTSVGTFTQIKPGNDISACTPECDGLAILSSGTTPFEGRFAIAGKNWIDSNDSDEMEWVASTPSTNVGFYLTDPNDVGARVGIHGVDGSSVVFTFDDIFGKSLANGQVFYIGIVSSAKIAKLEFFSDPDKPTKSPKNDGYGIDKFTVGSTKKVPEPGVLLLLGAGLIALCGVRRRQAG